jgi:ribosomal protein L11 methyltransferase
MLINSLVATDLSDKNVLDHGTGTGVLAIYAKHLGANHVVAVDIDEKSVENAKENAALNGVDIDIRLGNTVPEGKYDLILANIHRNVLLANMEAYAKALSTNGELWLSGFYEEDCPMLQAAAEHEGLTLTDVLANGEWRLMRCRKEER